MKDLRKLVPQEELDALFKEVYQREAIKETREDNKDDKKIEKEFLILGYKVKKILKKSFVSILPVNFQIDEVFSEGYFSNTPLISLGYDLEGKFRFFISVEEKIISILDAIINKEIFIKEKSSTQQYIEAFLEKSLSEILEEIPLRKKKLISSSLSFYEDEVEILSFNARINNKEIKIFISFDKILFEVFEISPFIFSPLTSVGKKNLNKLKEVIPVKVVSETYPIKVPFSLLREGSEIPLKGIKIKNSKYI